MLLDPPHDRTKTAQQDGEEIVRSARPTLDLLAQTVRVDYRVSRRRGGVVVDEVEESHLLRFLFPGEVELLARAAGFEVVRVCPFLDPTARCDPRLERLMAVEGQVKAPMTWMRDCVSSAVAAAGHWIGLQRGRLGRRGPRAHAYWERRARAHGARAVVNLAHPPASFEAVTLRQKELLLPLFRDSLRGDERTVLDFGCGPGRFTEDLAALAQGRAVGVDPVSAFFSLAPRSPRTEFVPLDGGRIPCPADFFDAAWICLVLGGLDDAAQAAAVAEIHRVLRPGGLLFLVENTSSLPDGAHWRFRSVERYRQLFPFAPLDHLRDYDDLGERISVLRGYKLPDALP